MFRQKILPELFIGCLFLLGGDDAVLYDQFANAGGALITGQIIDNDAPAVVDGTVLTLIANYTVETGAFFEIVSFQ